MGDGTAVWVGRPEVAVHSAFIAVPMRVPVFVTVGDTYSFVLQPAARARRMIPTTKILRWTDMDFSCTVISNEKTKAAFYLNRS